MSKTKLIPEQKAYLKSIESKKKRKKLKKEFRQHNEASEAIAELFNIANEHIAMTHDKLREITDPKTPNSDLKTTCFSLEDLKNTFTMSRYMKSLGGGDDGIEKATYYYQNFEEFLKDL